jgi:hypothetical protein
LILSAAFFLPSSLTYIFLDLPFHGFLIVFRISLGRVFLLLLWFSLVSFIPSMPCSFCYHWHHIILTIDSIVK